MFEAAGWQAITVKYGRRLRRAVRARAAATRCARRIDEMPNEEYQRLLRSEPARAARAAAGRGPRPPRRSSGCRASSTTTSCARAIRDLGGHDLGATARRLRRGRRRHRPADGDLRLHDQGLEAADRGPPRQPLGAALRRAVGGARAASSAPTRPTRGPAFDPDETPEAELCAGGRAAGSQRRRRSLRRAAARPRRRSGAPHRGRRPRPSRRSAASSSTSRRAAPEVAERVVTVSPDVASSTNLGGWINHVGIWQLGERIDWFADDTDTLVRWRESDARPAHRARHRRGQPRRPARRARRDLVARRPAAAADRHALRPVRQPRARAVVVRHLRGRPVDPRRHPVGRHARPRGRRAPVDHHAVGRARAAGLHRLGAGLRPGPRVDAAPRARRGSAGPDGTSSYFRLTTRPIDQALAARARRTRARASERRRQALAGGYRAATRRRAPAASTLVGVGAVMPEVLAAADELDADGVAVDVVCLTSADLVFRALQARQGLARRRRPDPRRAVPGRARARRSSPCSTATRTRSASSSAIRVPADRLPRRRRLRPVRRRRRPLRALRHRRRHDRRRRARPAPRLTPVQAISA